MEQNNGKAASILIVDDSIFLRKRIRQVLESDYSLLEAGSGITALAVLEGEKVDLIVTDLVMPDLDGFGLLTALNKHHPEIPIIVLTADIQNTTRERCEQLGAKAFLQKPVDADQLRAVVSGTLGRP